VSERTPGQAAREAHQHAILDGADDTTAWEIGAKAALDAYGVLAAVKAADGDTIVIAFSRPLDERTAHEIRERWSAGAPGVTLAIVDNIAAIKGRQP